MNGITLEHDNAGVDNPPPAYKQLQGTTNHENNAIDVQDTEWKTMMITMAT